MNLDDPPFLAVGTEVSAKYKGAFCEAKIRKISKIVKCKVRKYSIIKYFYFKTIILYSNVYFFIKVQYSNGISAFVTDDVVKGPLKVIHYNLYNIQIFYFTLHYILIYTFC